MPISYDDGAARKALDAITERVKRANSQIVMDAAHLIEARAASKLHSGYGVMSGTMRRSAHVSGPLPKGTDSVYSEVGPGVIYARRFELGFTGPDSLGRRFPFRPRPYWKPAYTESEADINTVASNYWADAVKEVTG